MPCRQLLASTIEAHSPRPYPAARVCFAGWERAARVVGGDWG